MIGTCGRKLYKARVIFENSFDRGSDDRNGPLLIRSAEFVGGDCAKSVGFLNFAARNRDKTALCLYGREAG